MKTTVHIFDYSDLPDTDWFIDCFIDRIHNDSLIWYWLEQDIEPSPKEIELDKWLRDQGVEEDKVLIEVSW